MASNDTDNIYEAEKADYPNINRSDGDNDRDKFHDGREKLLAEKWCQCGVNVSNGRQMTLS